VGHVVKVIDNVSCVSEHTNRHFLCNVLILSLQILLEMNIFNTNINIFGIEITLIMQFVHKSYNFHGTVAKE